MQSSQMLASILNSTTLLYLCLGDLISPSLRHGAASPSLNKLCKYTLQARLTKN